ncbi:molybdate ABC transporter permease subunit [Zhihengliuella halotolerans]|uniref:Molybdate transport system permease protein n=1 Tax=Zhihengliuella halotolerans TaxID=370736 RepID=A0A4Q8ADN5_9MICC|nr:ABC transporter permease subunit [Zhihengliuella halotolerans]RZU61881.1 molybdate transport system permease protein [Zhihengliuella halotolerans]
MSGSEAPSPRLVAAITPGWLWVPALVAVAVLAGPVIALTLATDPARLAGALSAPGARDAVVLSLATSGLSTLLCLVLGLPLAVLLHRMRGPGWRAVVLAVLRIILIVPLVLSPVVSGLALLYLWGRQGLLGGALEAMGLPVAYTPAAVVLVQVFVALPFLTVAALSSLEGVDGDLELAAANSGASATQILRHVTFPLAAPGIVLGALLAFARALGEYGATITFAGSVAGATRTIPLQIELAFNSADPEAALGLALALIGFYLFVIAAAGLAYVLLRRGREDRRAGRDA